MSTTDEQQGKLIDEPPDEPEAPPAPPPAAQEIAPRKPRFFDRARARRRRTAKPGPERAPRAKRRIGRRVALDADISDLWAFAGRRLEASPQYPTGRMLQYQAPAAGVILDKALAGTLPDRVLLQPLARNRGKYEDVGFLLAGPLLTFSITATLTRLQAAVDENDKDAYDELSARLAMQRELFTWVLQMMLPRLAIGAKLAEEKKAKRDAVIAEAFPDLGADDPATVLANMLFVPPHFQEATDDDTRSPDPSANANAGRAGDAF